MPVRTFLNILERWTGRTGIVEEPPIPSREMRFTITKVIDGNTHYLRFCSTTGEPLWEDRITRDTELYNSSASAWREVNGYFLTGVFKNVSVRAITLDRIPAECDSSTKFYSVLPR